MKCMAKAALCIGMSASYIVTVLAMLGGRPASAAEFLRHGEKLYFGSWLVSENGKFRMGFRKDGLLVIEDLGDKPIMRMGRTLWHPSVRSISSGLDLDAAPGDGYRSPFHLDNAHEQSPWGTFLDERTLAGSPKIPAPGGAGLIATGRLMAFEAPAGQTARTLEIVGHQLVVRNREGKTIWRSEPIPRDWDKKLDARGCEDMEKYELASQGDANLYLENTGRAYLWGTKGRLWCSCGYCVNTVPIQEDFYNPDNPLRRSEFLGIKARFGGMPTHRELKEEFEKMEAAAGGASESKATASCGAHASPSGSTPDPILSALKKKCGGVPGKPASESKGPTVGAKP